MTREEAIKDIRENIKPIVGGISLDMAIEALEAEPYKGEEVITVKDGTLKMVYGRFVIYDREFLKTHFNTTEAKIYGEPCEDCISRQAAIDAMFALCDTGETLAENKWRDNPHIDAITDELEKLPSVKPERKKGKWVHMVGFWECDQCHAEYTDMPTCMGEALYDYCPYCGAEMEVH